MISIYKSIHAVYWIVGICCIIGAVLAVTFFPKFIVGIILLEAIIVFATLFILLIVTKNKFKNEVMFLIYECRAQEYMEKVEALLGNRKSKKLVSTYSWLMALGYDVIGDHEAMYKHCKNITVKADMTEYHRRMCSYYIEKDQIELAKLEIGSLKVLANKAKGPEKIHVERYIGECERAVRIKLHDVEGLDDYFEGSGKTVEPVLLTRVSAAETYGQVLIFKGEIEKAREQLLFASRYGGDTKYKRYADILLESLNGG